MEDFTRLKAIPWPESELETVEQILPKIDAALYTLEVGEKARTIININAEQAVTLHRSLERYRAYLASRVEEGFL